MKSYVMVVSSFLLLGIFTGPKTSWSQNSGTLPADTPEKMLARDILKELTEINTTQDEGSTKAAEAMAARLRKAGFPESDIHLTGPGAEHMNLVVRYRGKGIASSVLFIGHLDVVEALKEDWSMDPFLFTEKDGYFYGRGTQDMKSDDAIMMASLIRLKQEGFVPDRDIVVALTEGEESGKANGIQWLLKNRRELIDAEYCINTDSGGGSSKNGTPNLMAVQTCEKIYCDFQLEVKNKGGHSALPVRDNAIYRLATALSRLAEYEFPIRLNETTRIFFERSAIRENGRTKADMLAVAKDPPDLSAAGRLAAISPEYNSKMRTTCVATMLSGGHAENALPQTARANINCRMIPEDTPENVLSTLKKVIADPEVSVTCLKAGTLSPRSPLRNDVMEIIESLTSDMWPGVTVTPVMSNGASDGKYLRAAGIPVYGLSGIFLDSDDIRAHGRDERLGVKEFYDGLDFMYRFMKSVTSLK